jgi:accessory gene regulator protein AgrB
VESKISFYQLSLSLLSSISFISFISYLSSIYLLSFIYYLLSVIHHRPRQAEHPITAALRARRARHVMARTAAVMGCSACPPLIFSYSRGKSPKG